MKRGDKQERVDPPLPAEESGARCASCEAMREALQRNKAELDAFVYRVSHDLKAPVVSIYGMASILTEDYQELLGEQGRHYLGRLMANAGFIERLIDDLLTYSRVGRKESNREEVQTEGLVQNVLSRFSKEISERKIDVKIRSPLPNLYFNRTQLDQLFSQLIGNAVRFIGDRPHPAIEIAAAASEGAVTFSVRDNGIGIDPQYHELIFGVFERLKEIESDGTGIGLALVKKIVSLAGGKVWVESKRGEGATFFFRLPR